METALRCRPHPQLSVLPPEKLREPGRISEAARLFGDRQRMQDAGITGHVARLAGVFSLKNARFERLERQVSDLVLAPV